MPTPAPSLTRPTRPPTELRDATADDAVAVAALLGQLGHPTPAEEVAARFAALGADDRVLVAEDATDGLVALHRIPRLAEGGCFARITALVVAPEARRRGVARELLEAAEGVARQWGCALVEVSSGRRPERTAAHALYRSLGYRDTVERSVRYWKVLR